jgi:hypothetical protein
MELSEAIIKGVSDALTLEELKERHTNAVLQMLANPAAIVSATTGGGASYTKSIQMTAAELVELLTYAINYKTNGVISNSGA